MVMANPFSEAAPFPNPQEKKNGLNYLDLLVELRSQLMKFQSGAVDQAKGAKEIRRFLARIHPDVHPGDKTMEQMAKIATQILDGYKDQESVDVEQREKLQSQFQILEQDLLSQTPAAPPQTTYRVSAEDLRSDKYAKRTRGQKPAEGKGEADNEIPPFEVVDFAFGEQLIGKKIYQATIDLSQSQIDRLFNPGASFSKQGGHRPIRFFQIEGVEGVAVPMRDYVGENQLEFGGWKLIKGIQAQHAKYLGKISYFEPYNIHVSGDRYDVGMRVKTDLATIRYGFRSDSMLGFKDIYGYCDVK